MARIKICGITNATDAQLAVKLGADALGFNFYPGSPRYVPRERAQAIIASLPPFVTPVGVFVNEDPQVIREVCVFCGITTVQLHGEEDPGDMGRFRQLKVIKAFRVRDEKDLRSLNRYSVDAYLLDAYAPDKKGGTGKTFDWGLVKSIALSKPVILAGGLTPDNVGAGIHLVRPFAVDVCSGVESEVGKKDRGLLRQFILAARRAFLEISQ